ncbi:unnamed protein product [Adineta ricciae]|uniref:Uncharacterized protein n=1 Tax=Adineta ricciae TaxID=249248 RepID=A0A814HJC7_ADIRI|nr:unnamed protein product [Adineta ricciae]CAF1010841.1 unnamed protein product [Adineta ricciae]
MTEQQYHTITSLDYENISELDAPNYLNNDFKNSMEILIAKHIGTISKNYQTELDRLSSYTYYPPMDAKQIRDLTIANITTEEIKRHLAEKIYKELEIMFETTVMKWNSIVQATTKRYVTTSVEQSIDIFRKQLSKTIQNDENQANNIILQRFILVNNQLKLV